MAYTNIFNDINGFIDDNKNYEFKSIYKASEHGCTPEAFHRHCDSKGPTLTVLYSIHNTTFGGYTSVSWTSEKNVYKSDSKAFLFYKTDNVENKCTKIPVIEKHKEYAIMCDKDHGPAFGSGKLVWKHDMLTFKGKTLKLDSEPGFDLDGYVNIGSNTYKPEGVNSGEVNGGSMKVKDVEVYQVTVEDLPEDWREPCQDVGTIKTTLERLEPITRLCVYSFNILLVGVIGAGKSSFYNSVMSAMTKTIVKAAPSGDAVTSITNQLHPYEIIPNRNEKQNLQIVLFDSKGFEQNRGFAHEIDFILDGRLPAGYKFPDKETPIEQKDLEPKKKLKDQIHLVCFVMDATKIEVLEEQEQLLEKITIVQQAVRKKGLQMVAVMTKIDELCPQVQKRTDALYRSPKVRNATEKVAARLGISECEVFPVCNYKKETKNDSRKDALLLHALVSMTKLIRSNLETKLVSKQKIDPWTTRGADIGPKKEFVHMEVIALAEQSELKERMCTVLLIGPIGSGKSSYVNSVTTTLNGEISNKTVTGSSKTSKTEKMFPIKYKDHAGVIKTLPVKLCDMPGLEEDTGVSVKSIEYILNGHVRSGYKIRGNIEETSESFKKQPRNTGKFHCVCFVLDISKDEMSDKIVSKMRIIQHSLQDREIPIPVLVLLTNIDKACSGVDNDTAEVYNSRKIKDKAEKTAETMKLNLGQILPVRNYTHEGGCDNVMDVLILESFKCILKSCGDYLEMVEEMGEADD